MRGAQRAIRLVHVALFQRLLPDRVGLYLHSVDGRAERLEELLGFLSAEGYSFVGPAGFVSAPDKSAFLSFDDNYRSWLRLLPILDRQRISVTFYVNSWPFRDRVSAADVQRYLATLRSDDDTTLSTEELREIAAAGHTIGAHTHTHPVLTTLPAAVAREEIRIGKVELEMLLQRKVEHFSYPFGMRRHFNEKLRAYCRSIGFATIANAIPCLQYAQSRPDSLHRSVWFLEQPLTYNLENVRVDGRLFHFVTGRSAVGGVPS